MSGILVEFKIHFKYILDTFLNHKWITNESHLHCRAYHMQNKKESFSALLLDKIPIFDYFRKRDINKKRYFSSQKQTYKKIIATNLAFWLMIISQNQVSHTEQNINVFYRNFLKTIYHYMIIYQWFFLWLY